MTTDRGILEAALIGYQSEIERMQKAMAEIRAALKGEPAQVALDGGGGDIPTPFEKPVRKRRKMSAAARKRIGDATRLRWALRRKAKK